MSGCGAGREAYGLPERRKRFLCSPLHHRRIAQGRVAPGVAIVQGDGALGVAAGNGYPLAPVHPPHVGRKSQGKAHESVSRGKVGAPLESLRQGDDRRIEILFREPPVLALGASNELPGAELVL